VLSVADTLVLEILPGSSRLAVEVDGQVAAHVSPGDQIELRPRPAAARVVRLGRTTFYERARRKLRLTDSAEIPPGELTDPHEPHALTGLRDPDDPHDLTGAHDLAAIQERAATERS
jgi:hypothetical protein